MMNNVTDRCMSLVVMFSVFVVASGGAFPSRFKDEIYVPQSRFFILPVTGNVYPLGYYFVTLQIGQQDSYYYLDIDTGSDLTWVQCDAPCVGCTKPPEFLYKPKNNIVPCIHPICGTIHSGGHLCESPSEQCDYEIDYADHGSSLGVLVFDHFFLPSVNGSFKSPPLAFGCGYDQKLPASNHVPPTCGVLGLGRGNVSILSQLWGRNVINNVFGHCLSKQGGYLFMGDGLVPSLQLVWAPMSVTLRKHYSVGPAELLFGGKSTGIKGMDLIFDSGSSYTYFNADVYKSILDLIWDDVAKKPLKDAPEEKALPLCWKGKQFFKSVNDIRNHFKPLSLRFTNTRNVQLQLHPQDYLIVTERGNACLGILNGTEVGLGNLNVIGDIFLQDRLVVYDNEKNRIGWVPANCDTPITMH